MADQLAINFVFDKLSNFSYDNANYVLNAGGSVQNLKAELNLLKGFLGDASHNPDLGKADKALVKEIRKACYEAQDIVDLYLTQSAIHESKGIIGRTFNAAPRALDLRSIAVKTNDLSARVKGVYQHKQWGLEALRRPRSSSLDAAAKTERRAAPVVEVDNVVGFEEEAATLVGRINGGPKAKQVITVVGTGGLGKTTLVKKVWNDRNVLHDFSIFCSVFVSEVYQLKDLYLDILKQALKKLPSNINATTSEEELVEEVKKALQWKYLIVLDDVWKAQDWDNISKAFPDMENGSRIIITSREEDVANHVNREGKHKLDFLNLDKSVELIEIKVFGCLGKCPPDLTSAALAVAERCGGLPLALVLMAGVLRQSINPTDWEIRARGVRTFVASNSQECLDILALSYQNLPYHLRVCFLYFGMFRRGHIIPAWTLIWLWIAEGLIQPDDDLELEETAGVYLDELARRSLVIVENRSSTGQIKTCRVHNMLLDLCDKEAAKEDFFHRVVKRVQDRSQDDGSDCRRICIHSDIKNFIGSKPSYKLAHSFVCFSIEDVLVEKNHVPILPRCFENARVLHAQPITFPIYPARLAKLLLLKYVAISGKFNGLPQALSESVNLQTLIFETKTPSQSIEVKADILKLPKLRHFRTNAPSKLYNTKPTSTSKEEDSRRSNLQTLSLITPDSCTKEVLDRTPYLKKLGIRGKLAYLLEEEEEEEEEGESRCDALISLKQLERLKLLTHIEGQSESEGKLSSFPPSSKFPQTLKKVTISGTMLPWVKMSVFGELPLLEVLKARKKAFQGNRWDVTGDGFLRLKVLVIEDTDLEIWEVSAAKVFPLLESIVLKYCQCLNSFPASFGESHSNVKTVKMDYCEPAVPAVKKIELQREKSGGKPLELVIFPTPK